MTPDAFTYLLALLGAAAWLIGATLATQSFIRGTKGQQEPGE
jgi:hypothetical protein